MSNIVDGTSVAEQLRIRDQGDDIPVQHIPELFSRNDHGFPPSTVSTELGGLSFLPIVDQDRGILREGILGFEVTSGIIEGDMFLQDIKFLLCSNASGITIT